LRTIFPSIRIAILPCRNENACGQRTQRRNEIKISPKSRR
jgi:hypothetical protein